MKIIFIFILGISQISLAKGGGESDTVADYIVPTSADLVPYSRFKVDILKTYKGDTTTELSYVFPRELTGDPALVAEFKLVSMDVDTNFSTWDSPKLTASCTADDSRVTCNIYVKKDPISNAIPVEFKALNTQLFKPTAMVPAINKADVLDFLNKSLDKALVQKQISVLDDFLESEPGGVLSYEFN